MRCIRPIWLSSDAAAGAPHGEAKSLCSLHCCESEHVLKTKRQGLLHEGHAHEHQCANNDVGENAGVEVAELLRWRCALLFGFRESPWYVG
jgi:hypothetical protein